MLKRKRTQGLTPEPRSVKPKIQYKDPLPLRKIKAESACKAKVKLSDKTRHQFFPSVPHITPEKKFQISLEVYHQRVKAAFENNPDLVELTTQFNEARATRKILIEELNKITANNKDGSEEKTRIKKSLRDVEKILADLLNVKCQLNEYKVLVQFKKRHIDNHFKGKSSHATTSEKSLFLKNLQEKLRLK